MVYSILQSVYEMSDQQKGKVCIISTYSFRVPWLTDMDGYMHDKVQLQNLWQQMGFDVYIPKTIEPFDSNQLTSEVFSSIIR